MGLRIKYPKLIGFFLTLVVAYLLVTSDSFLPVRNAVSGWGYLGTFFFGVLFSYGFTAGPATAGFLVLAKTQDLLLAGLIGGLGSLVGDFLIFRFVRSSFSNEIDSLKKECIFVKIKERIPQGIAKHIVPVIACFIIASPLPDEIGVSMLAASESMSQKEFAVISYFLNTMGILVILFAGKMLF